MSKRVLKPDIEFTLDGVNYSLIPMKQKVAAHVFHECLTHILSAIAQAVSGKTDADKIAKFAQSLPEVASFNDVWFILEHVMKSAMVDGREIKNLDESGIFEENPHHMYLVVFHAIKGNWPNYFSKMETKMGGFVSKLKASFETMNEAEPRG